MSADDQIALAEDYLRHGQDEQAKWQYVRILSEHDRHPKALLGLGKIALGQGYRQAARSALLRLLEHDPNHEEALTLIGYLHLQDHELELAHQAFSSALSHQPDLFMALQGMAQTLTLLGKTQEVQSVLERAGQCGDAIRHWPHRGTGFAPKVILLLSLHQGNVPTQHFIHDRLFELMAIHVESWPLDWPLPEADVVFNAIGDAELCSDALQRCIQIVDSIHGAVLNHPRNVLQTSRLLINRLAETIPDMIVPRLQSIENSIIEHRDQLQYPFLIRALGYHGGTFFERVDSLEQLKTVIESFPPLPLYQIELMPSRDQDGYYRKYRVLWIDGCMYPIHLAISTNWKVHYVHARMHESESCRQEEARFLGQMEQVLGRRAFCALQTLFQSLNLDYVGADFTLSPEGQVLLFECNPTMLIAVPPQDSIWDYRRESFQRAMDACHRLMGLNSRV